jgi:hypothetical protein
MVSLNQEAAQFFNAWDSLLYMLVETQTCSFASSEVYVDATRKLMGQGHPKSNPLSRFYYAYS